MTNKKLVIPTILAATILVAGMFALMPVQKASTVHTTITAKSLEVKADTDATAAAVTNGLLASVTPSKATTITGILVETPAGVTASVENLEIVVGAVTFALDLEDQAVAAGADVVVTPFARFTYPAAVDADPVTAAVQACAANIGTCLDSQDVLPYSIPAGASFRVIGDASAAAVNVTILGETETGGTFE